jgi:hypothetical protein
MVEFSVEEELKHISEASVHADFFEDYFASSQRGYFVGAGMSVLRRDEFMKTGGFTERRINAEDHDLILRMGDARGFVQVTSPVTLGWRRHAGSATTNLPDTIMGSSYLVEQERRGAYPGGAARERERQRILTRHVRPVSLDCLRQGMRREAWELYSATLSWHARLGGWKYLMGFPLKAAFGNS